MNQSRSWANRFYDFPIQKKLMVLSSVLLIALLVTNGLGGFTASNLYSAMQEMRIDIRGMKKQTVSVEDALEKEKETLKHLEVSEKATAAFDNFKYWMTDLSVSWLNEAEDNALASRETLRTLLQEMSVFASQKDLEEIRSRVDRIYSLGIQAVDAYIDENRVQGNALLAEVKKEAGGVDQVFLSILTAERTEAFHAKEAALSTMKMTLEGAETVIAQADDAIDTAGNSLKGGAVLLLVMVVGSILMTRFSIRSLVTPVETIVKAMRVLATGDVSVEIPPVKENEMGTLAEALQVFKTNKIEADRLADKQAAAQAEKLKRSEVLERLIKNFERKATGALQTVETVAEDLQQTAGQRAEVVEEVDARLSNVSTASKETSNSVQSVASASGRIVYCGERNLQTGCQDLSGCERNRRKS